MGFIMPLAETGAGGSATFDVSTLTTSIATQASEAIVTAATNLAPVLITGIIIAVVFKYAKMFGKG